MIESVKVDFDGTTTITDKFPFIEGINQRAIEVLSRFQKAGGIVILDTAREDIQLQFALKALAEAGFKPDYANENIPARIKKFGSDCRKVMADVFIDDRDIDYTGDWDKYESILCSPENLRLLRMKPKFKTSR